MSALAHLSHRPLIFLYPIHGQRQLCARALSTSTVRCKGKDDEPSQKKKPLGQFKGKNKSGKPPPKKMPSNVNYNDADPAWFVKTMPDLALQSFEPASALSDINDDKIIKAIQETVFDTAIGEPLAFPMRSMRAFRAYGLPSSNKWSYTSFSILFSAVRDVTVQLLTQVNAEGQRVRSVPEPTGIILQGRSGCGKSTLLMQAVSHCVENGWIVMYIPRGIDLVNSSSPYQYDARSKLFQQPEIARGLLKGLVDLHLEELAKIRTVGDVLYGDKGQTFAAGGELLRLAQIGLEDEVDKTAVLEGVLEQLGKQTEYPFLFAVDDFGAMYGNSIYRDPQFFPIKGYHLSIPRIVLEYAIGERQLSRGLVLGAIGPLHTLHTTPVPLREAIGAELCWKDAAAGAYAKRHPAQVHYSQGLRGFPVPDELGVEAARGWYKTWIQGFVMHTQPSDDFFLAKYTEASGNAREFSRALLQTMQ